MSRIERYGVKVMSIGFLVDEDTAMIWRGPMVMSAFTQMLRDVAWGELDVWSSICRLAPATRS
jgi:ATP-binding protein involved in chromosome partitioning